MPATHGGPGPERGAATESRRAARTTLAGATLALLPGVGERSVSALFAAGIGHVEDLALTDPDQLPLPG